MSPTNMKTFTFRDTRSVDFRNLIFLLLSIAERTLRLVERTYYPKACKCPLYVKISDFFFLRLVNNNKVLIVFSRNERTHPNFVSRAPEIQIFCKTAN